MASGRVFARIQAALGIIGLIALAVTYVIVSGHNPLPAAGRAVTGWLERAGSLSKPEAAWVQRLGDQPEAATIAGGAVVFTTVAGAEARAANDGRALWRREARWVAVAGDGAGAVTLLGKGRGKGYDAVDPTTGAVRWAAGGVAVWAYRDALLSLACPSGKDCVLTARSPTDGGVRWSAPLPARASVLAGAHVSATNLPPVLGFRVDDRMHVLDAATGSRMHQEAIGPGKRVTVLGGRLVRSSAVARDRACRYTVEAFDVVAGRVAWKSDAYDLGTASDADCAQRREPSGTQRALVAKTGDDRPVLVSTVDGRQVWSGGPGDKVVAVDDQGVVVRAADGKSIASVSRDGRLMWTRVAAGNVTLTGNAVVVIDAGTGRLVAYDRAGAAVLADVATQASVLGADPTGLVLAVDRTVGILPLRAR